MGTYINRRAGWPILFRGPTGRSIVRTKETNAGWRSLRCPPTRIRCLFSLKTVTELTVLSYLILNAQSTTEVSPIRDKPNSYGLWWSLKVWTKTSALFRAWEVIKMGTRKREFNGGLWKYFDVNRHKIKYWSENLWISLLPLSKRKASTDSLHF